MAKKVGRPKTSDRNDVSIKFDRLLAARARHVAESKGISMAQYLSEISRAQIDREYGELLRDLEGRSRGSDI